MLQHYKITSIMFYDTYFILNVQTDDTVLRSNVVLQRKIFFYVTKQTEHWCCDNGSISKSSAVFVLYDRTVILHGTVYDSISMLSTYFKSGRVVLIRNSGVRWEGVRSLRNGHIATNADPFASSAGSSQVMSSVYRYIIVHLREISCACRHRVALHYRGSGFLFPFCFPVRCTAMRQSSVK